MLAFDLLDVFLSMIWFFLFIMWISLVIHVFADIFRSRDLGGAAKVVWILLVMFVPLFGVFLYLIARGGKMAENDQRRAKAEQDAIDAYIRQAAGTSGSVADELSKLANLRDAGTITAEDFAAAKSKLLV